MRIFIEPTEPLLFRNGRPFSAGENNFAESLFPPTPETLQGAVRATIAVHWGQAQQPVISNLSEIFEKEELNALIGKRKSKGDVYGRFRITGMTIGRREQDTNKIKRIFPAPANIMQATLENEAGKTSPVILRPKKPEMGTTNMPKDYDFLPLPDLHGRKSAGKSKAFADWLTPVGLAAVLRGELPDEKDRVKETQIFAYEPRLGIGMDNDRKTTKEPYLYQIQMIRMQPDYGFVVDIALGDIAYQEDDKPPKSESHTDAVQAMPFLRSGWMTLGGEQRAAHFTVLAPEAWEDEKGISRTQEGNLLYFATPAYFEQGWRPGDAAIFPARPISAAINRYQPIGGWYLKPQHANGGYKEMRRCIPAGSVYFFDKDEEITSERPFTEYGWQIGYGIAYTGRWKS